MNSGWDKNPALLGGELLRKLKVVHAACSTEARRSIVAGSALTGAPGQPVDTGRLKGSWILDYPEPYVSRVVTDVVYAPIVEDAGLGRASSRAGSKSGSGRYSLRSKVGGFHSVKLTRVNFERIVDRAVRKEVYGND